MGGILTTRCFRRISTLGATTVPLVPFFKAPPATLIDFRAPPAILAGLKAPPVVLTDLRADDTAWRGGAAAGVGATGEGDLDLAFDATVDGPAAASESLSESEESKSDDDEPGAVGRRFGFQSACLDLFLPFIEVFDEAAAAWAVESVSSMTCSVAFPFPLPRTSSSLLLSLPSPCLFLSLSIPFLTTRSSRPSFLS
jgi:hypothetical protein